MTYRTAIALLVVYAASNWSVPARADPCEGKLPAKGATFTGVVRYVGDGDGLCIGPSGRPDSWIEIRLADFYAPELHEKGGAEAKRRLERIAWADHWSAGQFAKATIASSRRARWTDGR